MANFCVLTYDAPHGKTQDLLMQLKARGLRDLTVLALPWIERKNFVPQIPHRPLTPFSLTPKDLVSNLGYTYVELMPEVVFERLQAMQPEAVLIGGAGILPAEWVQNFKFVNAHPGLIPLVRGLDALKWAIYDDLPVGVTLHIVDEEADMGIILKQMEVPLYDWDTFHAFAYRQYEYELNLLAEYPFLYDKNIYQPTVAVGGSVVRRRMPNALEAELLDKFAQRKQKLKNR